MFNTRRGKIISISAISIVFILLIFTVIIKVNKIDISSMSAKEMVAFEFLKDRLVKKGSIKNTFEIEHNSYSEFCTYKNYVVSYDKNGIKFLNVKDGSNIWSQPYTMVNPVAQKGNKCLVIGDMGGKTVILINDKNVLWNKTFEGKIRNVKIDKKDNVAVIMEGDGYKSVVQMFDKGGEAIVNIGRKDDLVMDAFLSKDGKKVILSCAVPSGAIVQAKIEIVNIESGETEINQEFDKGIFTSMWHTSKDVIYALTDNLLVCYDGKGEEKYREEFEIIYSADIVNGKNLTVAVKEGDTTKIYTFSEKGRLKDSYNINSEVEKVQAIGDIVAVVCKKDIYFFNDKTYYIREYTKDEEFRACDFFSERNIMFEFFNRIENVGL